MTSWIGLEQHPFNNSTAWTTVHNELKNNTFHDLLLETTPYQIILDLLVLPFAFSKIAVAAMSIESSALYPRAGSGIYPRDGGQQSSPEEEAAEKAAIAFNKELSDYLYIICGSIAAAVILWKLIEMAIRHTRHVVCIHNEHQRYFTIPSYWNAFGKRHIFYAPLWSKRHNREIQLSSVINVGTLPTRFQLLFLAAYFGTNIGFCFMDIPWDNFTESMVAVRKRSGVLSVVNMVCTSYPHLKSKFA